jgi:hypothetical protein
MNRKRIIWMVGVPVLVLLGATGAVVGRYAYLLGGQAPTKERIFRTSTGGTPHYDPIQYRAKDSRPAIVEPQFVSAGEANRVGVLGGTKGIGVSIDGDSRFYPLFVLQYHQIVNDTCGDKPVACSY